MIQKVLHSAHRATRWLDRTLGPSYRVVLVVGLTAEIGQHVREISRAASDIGSTLRSILVIVVAAALMLNTFASLYEQLARREMRRRS